MDDPTRAYLSRVIDWGDVVKGDAWVNIHFTDQVQQDNKTSNWPGYSSSTIDDALKQVWWAVNKNNNVFLRQSTSTIFIESKIAGAWNRAAKRLQANAATLRTFFFDLDVKPGAYATTQDAWADLYRVCAEAKLPHPQVIVLSGSGGMHVYWVLDRGIDPATWRPLAMAFIKLLQHHKLQFDQQCSSDSVRVLRVPGSFNFKGVPQGGTPTQVQLAESAWIDQDYTLAELRAVLDPFAQQSNVVPLRLGPGTRGALAAATHGIQGIPGAGIAIAPQQAPLPDTGEFSGGMDRSAPVEMDRVTAYCGVFRDALATGGEGHANGLWHQLVYNATFAPDPAGRAYAHAFSKGDPRYTAAETDAEYDRALATRAADPSKGWTACTTFGNLAATTCAACPLAGKIGYPMAIGTPGGARQISQILGAGMVRPEAAPVIQPSAPQAPATTGAPPLAWPYYRNELGIWREQQPDAKTGVKPPDEHVLPRDIAAARLERHNGDRLILSMKMPFGVVEEVSINCARMAPVDLQAAFGVVSIGLHDRQLKTARAFLVDFLNQLRNAVAHMTNTPALGWIYDGRGGYRGFAYDGTVHGAGTPSGGGDPNFLQHYKPIGNLQDWQTVAQFVLGQGRQDMCAIVAASFASPLVEFSGQSGLFISAYSPESGIGKTGAMRVAASVWSRPSRTINTMKDSENVRVDKAGKLRSLPVLWDELGAVDNAKRLPPVVFQLCQGRDKGRLTADIQQREPGTWRTMMVCASNHSMRDLMAQADRNSDPGTNRTFEFRVEPSPNGTPSASAQIAIDNLLDAVEHNFGQAGLVYARWLGANHATVKQAYDLVKENLIKRVGNRTDERFWTASMCCLITGAYLANRLGICRFDVPALEDYLVRVLSELRYSRDHETTSVTTADGVMAVLARYYSALQGKHVVITDCVHRGRGKPHVKLISDLADGRAHEAVYMQIGVADRVIRIDREHFKEWLRTARYSPRPSLMDCGNTWPPMS